MLVNEALEAVFFRVSVWISYNLKFREILFFIDYLIVKSLWNVAPRAANILSYLRML